MKQKFIPGIYNYCDRWCERCSFTTRCRNFVQRDSFGESTGNLSSEQLDISNKAFWDTIAGNFQKAIEMLHKAAKKYGVDLDNLMTKEEEDAYEKQRALLHTAAKNHLLSKLCKRYQKIAKPFVKKSEGVADKTRELVSHLHLGLKTEEEVVHTVAGIGNCFEIIQWYLFFIDAKLQRALHGKLEGDEDNDYPKDSNGTAKIAIIAIERSIVAWSGLYELIPASEDTALNALSVLSQLKQKAMEEFPDAMQFIRPGFDD